MKQAMFSNAHYHDYTNTKQYADLFISPPLNVNPNMYSFETPVPAYPLDTVIPNYPVPQKVHDPAGAMHFAMEKKPPNSELENLLTTKATSPTTDLENMLKIPDADLLSFFTTSNTESQEGPGDFAIPSTSAGIFESFSPEVYQETPMSSQAMGTWREGEKWVEGQAMQDGANQLHLNDSDPSSFWTTSSPSQLTPLLQSFPSLNHDLPLPTTSYSPPPPPSHNHTPTISPSQSTVSVSTGGSNKGGFDDQLDFFDLDLDSMFPPTKKFQEYPPTQSEASSPVSHMHVSPTPTPVPTAPSSPVESKPDIKPSLPSTPVSTPDPASVKSTKPSPLLFGKSEDEILLKVLVPQPGLDTKPVTRDKLISMPVEEFNRLLSVAGLNDIEVAFMKEWRRRGKNKTAAMVARKRKRDELTDLDVEVEQLRKQKTGLKSKYDQLRSDIVALRERAQAAEDRVYRRYSLQSGIPVSRDSHMIHIDKGGKVLLAPRPSNQMLLVK